jgi:hypothetical protein
MLLKNIKILNIKKWFIFKPLIKIKGLKELEDG